MIEMTDKSKCSGCYACFNACPKNCIEMIGDEEGFYYPQIRKESCVNCGICEKVCPILHSRNIENIPTAYAAYNKDEDIRRDSSSGGVFTLLAEEILNQNGVVFGACFDREFNVVHDYIESVTELPKFRGSKYVQSNIGNAYKEAKEFLEEGRNVLFTGTPCQIGGLKAYLRKDYKKLICQDIICHGVPSSKVWKKYIAYREKCADAPAQRISFRRKDEGWKKYSVSFLFKNDTEYCETLDKDLMMKAYLKNICLRPSCYSCSYKTTHRESDITLADFWGIQNLIPEMDDNKGTSLVILNSEKGERMFSSIRKQMVCKETEFQEAIQFNSAMSSSVLRPSERRRFFGNFDRYEFDELVRKYCTDNNWVKIKRKIRSILSIRSKI